MFCPPGYIDWHEMQRIAHNLANQVYLADALDVLDENPQFAFLDSTHARREILRLLDHRLSRKRLRLKDQHFEIGLISFWILVHMCDKLEPALCSPSGNVLKAPFPIFFHPDQFFYFYLSFPLREMSEFHTTYKEYDANRLKATDFETRFSCIDAEHGLVKHKNQTVDHFRRYFGDGFIGETSRGDGGTFEMYVKPFLGWSIVLSEEILPERSEELLQLLLVGEEHWFELEQPDTPPQKRRGPKPGPAKGEFFSRYPLGIPDNLSADAIAAELTEGGYKISGRQVQYYDAELRKKK